MRKEINNVMKVSICVLMIVLSFIISNVYAESSCNIGLKTSSTKVGVDEEFTVEVNAFDIQSEMGIMAFGATIEYDKNYVSLEKLEGLNDWETPTRGLTYNEENGKIAITKNGLGKDDETIIRITFKAKSNKKKEQTITLKDIIVSDGTKPIEVNDINQKINIEGKSNFIRNAIIIIVVIIVILFIIKNSNKKK